MKDIDHIIFDHIIFNMHQITISPESQAVTIFFTKELLRNNEVVITGIEYIGNDFILTTQYINGEYVLFTLKDVCLLSNEKEQQRSMNAFQLRDDVLKLIDGMSLMHNTNELCFTMCTQVLCE